MKYYNLKEEKLIIKEITRKGICVIDNVFNKKQIEKYKKSITQNLQEKIEISSSLGQQIISVFIISFMKI